MAGKLTVAQIIKAVEYQEWDIAAKMIDIIDQSEFDVVNKKEEFEPIWRLWWSIFDLEPSPEKNKLIMQLIDRLSPDQLTYRWNSNSLIEHLTNHRYSGGNGNTVDNTHIDAALQVIEKVPVESLGDTDGGYSPQNDLQLLMSGLYPNQHRAEILKPVLKALIDRMDAEELSFVNGDGLSTITFDIGDENLTIQIIEKIDPSVFESNYDYRKRILLLLVLISRLKRW